jgi:hypothetical protein
MSSDVPEVRLRGYASCIAGQLQEPLKAQTVKYAYGMQGMSSDVPEVRSVLDMLPWCWAAAKPLDAQKLIDVLSSVVQEQRVSVGYASLAGSYKDR